MDRENDALTTPQLREKVMAKQGALADKWARARTSDVDENGQPYFDFMRIAEYEGDQAARLEKLRAEQSEIDDLTAQLNNRVKLDQQARNAALRSEQSMADLSRPVDQGIVVASGAPNLGELFVRSRGYAGAQISPSWNFREDFPDFDIRNAVVSTGAGFAPPEVRLGRIIDSAQTRLSMVDVVPMFPTGADTIRYMEETTYTATNVVEKAEVTATAAADVAGEAALAWTERTQTVEWIPAFIPVTTQQLEDVDGIQARISQRLARMVRARLSTQLIAGNGTSPNLLGLASRSGIQTQAKGTDDTPTAFYKALANIQRYEDYNPDTVVMHPMDAVEVFTLKTADGQFIWGNPASAQQQTLWGLPVVQASEATAGTGFVGDFGGFSGLYVKRGITIAVSDSHGFYFTRGQLAIRVDMRAAAVWEAANAFSSVTGI